MRSLVISDSLLTSWAKQPDLVNIIPPLRSLNARKGCGCKGRNQKTTRPLQLAKDYIASSTSAVMQLKNKFSVDQIVVYVKTDKGIVKKEL